MRLRKLWTALWERAWLVALCVLLGGGLAALYLYSTPPTFVATAVIKYDVEKAKLLGLPGGGVADVDQPAIERRMKEIRRELLSPRILRRVADKNKLSADSYYTRSGLLNSATREAWEGLLAAVQVDVPAGETVVRVTATATSAQLAADLANQLCDEVIGADIEDQRMRLLNATRQLTDRLREEEAKRTAAGGQSRDSAVRLGEVQQKLEDWERRHQEAERQRDGLKRCCEQIARHGTNVDGLLQVAAIATNAAVTAAQGALARQETAFEDVKKEYKEKHPKYRESKAELERLQGQLAEAVMSTARELQALHQKARDEEDAIRKESEALRREATDATDAAALEQRSQTGTNDALASQLSLLKRYYNSLATVGVAEDATGSLLQNDPGSAVPPRRAGPNWLRILIAGVAGGFVLGLLLALVFGLGDTSLRSVDEAEMVLRLPVLGVVPVLHNEETEMAAAEGFRSLRTSISVLSKGNEPRSVLFTSTSPDEGKTFCALNFAVGLAQQGMRTVLIECDLRRPMAAPSLAQVKIDHAGVSDFLRKAQPKASLRGGTQGGAPRPELSFAEVRRKQREVTGASPAPSPIPSGDTTSFTNPVVLDEVLQHTEIQNLAFIAAGTPVSNPSELLAQPNFSYLIGELLKRFDRVIVDSAPMLGISDTLLLSNRVQAVCFVVRANQTPRRAVVRAVEILKRADAPIVGLVLNGLTPKKSDPYGQSYYYYHRTEQQRKKS